MTTVKPSMEYEEERLAVLAECHIVDTPPEVAYDDLVRLTANLFAMPIAGIALVDSQREWFKAACGLDQQEHTRVGSFSAVTLQHKSVCVFSDMIGDRRFVTNPLVAAGVCFYAGVPLITADGYSLGALCVMDYVPRTLTADQTETLRLLGSQVVALLEQRRAMTRQERSILPQPPATDAPMAVLNEDEIINRRLVEDEHARLAAIVESSPDAITATTLDALFVCWNPGAERVYGYTAAEMLGQHAARLFPMEEDSLLTQTIQGLFRGEPQENVEATITHKDNYPLHLSMTFSLIRNAHGAPIGIACIARDMTEQRLAEEQIRRSEARLAEAQRVARFGSWELDVLNQEYVWSEEMFRIFGMEPQATPPPYETVLALCHPDDALRWSQMIDQTISSRQPTELDWRIVLSDGAVRWCHGVGKPMLDEAGAVVRVIGTIMDITDRMLSQERFKVLFELSSEPHLLCDEHGIMDCNRAFLDLVCCADKSLLIGQNPGLLSPEYQPNGERTVDMVRERRAKMLAGGTHRFEWLHQKMDGTEFPVAVSITPVTLGDRPVSLAVWHDLTERKEAEAKIKAYSIVLESKMAELEHANRQLEMLATTDGLTGLKNHRAFQERLADEFGTAVRYQTSLSVVLLDVDCFKQYNDAFGHPAGDAVLKRVAKLLEDNLRVCDVVARYGGEEFVVILPQTDSENAALLAERCRAAIENAHWDKRTVTASFGIASLLPDVMDSATLITEADKALYVAKHNGRNQVVHARGVATTDFVVG